MRSFVVNEPSVVLSVVKKVGLNRDRQLLGNGALSDDDDELSDFISAAVATLSMEEEEEDDHEKTKSGDSTRMISPSR